MDEFLKAKVGDTVHVRATVHRAFDGEVVTVSSDIRGVSRRFPVEPQDIVHVESRSIQVGDKVHPINSAGLEYEVLGVRGEWLWLQLPRAPYTEARVPVNGHASNFERVTD